MDLPNSLLIDFAKTIKQDKTPGDVTVFGRVIRIIDPEYADVRLDGSSTNTTCRIAAVCAVGDMVTVLIKDHKAVLTSNITNPASSEHSESSYIHIMADGSIAIGTVGLDGNSNGFYIRSNGYEYEIRDINNVAIFRVNSTGIYTVANKVLDESDVDTMLSSSSSNPVKNSTITSIINGLDARIRALEENTGGN